ncbi:MAG: AAA family ATPase [Desulfatibacillaceae bacterium]
MSVVCISRQFGAGGRTLAGRVAEKLGYEFADTALTHKVAESLNVSDEWVKVTEREGHGRKGLVSSLISSSFVERIAGRNETGSHEEEVYQAFCRHIPEMAAQDRKVFIGRGSQFVCGDCVDAVRVLLVAPIEWRENFLVENHNLTREESRQTVREWDRNRASFLGKFTDRDPDDPSLYDVTINTSLIRLEWAEALICDLARKREAKP